MQAIPDRARFVNFITETARFKRAEANRQKITAVTMASNLLGANPELSMEIATETYEIS
ncbi:hypothetical protein LEP1GSC043_0737 [Leptospira weilii str. Ecochallenge]|uniref:Uncharacterized protein n=2 Tax=Leptospira weilii TaxID=28184 RepID=N1TY44_9LEPT|nr:hypothetical protein LEP1GSC108_1259 [Leptospira weilii str. UI 13098]EMY13213.1 hypothetical protein LEP1GSC043_0737 [Leptospira weilii str. Ecochallenge]